MSETRYRRQFDIDGNELPSIPYEVSDKQLYQEQLVLDMNDIHNVTMQIYQDAGVVLNNWGSLSPAQKDVVLKKSVQTIRGLIK